MRYKSGWWVVDLPSNWSGQPDDACSTFRAEPPEGVLQISAARKETGLITDGDLREFASARLSRSTDLRPAGFGPLVGFTAVYRSDGLFWQEWWLRSDHVMVYVTYNVGQGGEATEQDDISSILSSLALEV